MRGMTVVAFAVLGLLTHATACDSSVLVEGQNDPTAGASDEEESGRVDERCFDACLTKGGTEAECAEACWTADSDPSGSGSSSGTGHGDDWDDDDDDDDDDDIDGMVERNCYECMEKKSGLCASEYAACEESLACTMLVKCPYECWGDEECIDECNTIIPSGVDTLTALLNCMICDGGPCQADCYGSVMTSYCN